MAICLAWRGAGRPFLALLVLLLGFPVGRGSQGSYGTRPCQTIGITSPDRDRSCCRACTSSGIFLPGKFQRSSKSTTYDERRGIVRLGREAGSSANRHYLGANGHVADHGACFESQLALNRAPALSERIHERFTDRSQQVYQ